MNGTYFCKAAETTGVSTKDKRRENDREEDRMTKREYEKGE